MSRSDADGSILNRLRRRVRTLARGGNRPITERPDERVDERDTMFARAERTPGTEAYDDYYERRPDLQETDDRIREKPGLGSPAALYYDPAVTPEADHYFESIEAIEPEAAVVAEWTERLETADEPGRVLREMAEELGAVDVGCTTVPQEYVYTEKGRFDE
ncbi:MAG TPA: hypothetical protein VJ898_08380, partial [Natrialbaceae archaeon]|nr:hypothetical protein [Natrialbaceae archaeon]